MTDDFVPMNEMVPVLVGEARRWRVAIAVTFALIALAALVIGLSWPKKFESSTTILVQKSNIITPLMEGRAVTTSNSYRASIAREVLFGRKVMDDILKTGGWAAANPTPLEQARLIDGIEGRTKISSSRDNLIHISYADVNAQRSYKVTQRLAHLFIAQSLNAKMQESRDAFDFIDSQVKSYHAKLTAAETKMKAYRAAHPDSRGSSSATDARISALRTDVEHARMSLTEQRSTERILESQLAGESEITTVQTRTGQLGAQLAQLQSQLQTLLLTYTNAYPDVVRTRHQIEDLKNRLAAADAKQQADKLAGAPTALDDTVKFNPLYQDLRSKLAETRRNIAATSARMGASQKLLESEMARSKRIANAEGAVAGLLRDYTVDRDVYQDLLKRRENARVSMNLDKKHRGLTFTIQDPATLPLRPTGLRFMHFGLAGLILGCAIPLGLLFTLARFDPRARAPTQLEHLGIPLLASVPTYANARERSRQRTRSVGAVLLVLIVAAAYAAVFYLKLRKLI